MIVERFAPSPTGELHLGHAFSALTGWRAARKADGQFLLRMEDLDTSRVRPEFADLIYEDLEWLGIDWDGPVIFQSERLAAYDDALAHLSTLGLLYACTCSRRDIAEAVAAPQEGAPMGPDGIVYPGTCRTAGIPIGSATAIRIDMARTLAFLQGADMSFEELDAGPESQTGRIPHDPVGLIKGTGDVVLKRRDGAPAYHLAVVVDDAWQGVTHVTRGRDLFTATPVHRILQALLKLPAPAYRHHRLIRDESGKRLAKRDRAQALSALRRAGWTPSDVRARIGLG